MGWLLFQNLKLTIPTALVFTGLGYILSLPLSFSLHPEAARWQFHLLRQERQEVAFIETPKLDELHRFQAQVAFTGAALGTLLAQTTFIVYVSKFGREQS
ncbi:hypothetical protein [Nostoc sp. MS1]|uniref:hypothetical protein n=1 Tax=Nostoc sp. MS1 TaxID=2764711 RepID=UPI001CC557A3|nr:hypothetical protein [Nostoc sp. MS1]BCL40107.1 hypothetical protein NSMS1_65540 [Nostoc sp. MS1]